jgi:hypothetical protein
MEPMRAVAGKIVAATARRDAEPTRRRTAGGTSYCQGPSVRKAFASRKR